MYNKKNKLLNMTFSGGNAKIEAFMRMGAKNTFRTDEISKLRALGQIGALGETSKGIILDGKSILNEPEVKSIERSIITGVIFGEVDRILNLHVSQFKLSIESLKSLTEDQVVIEYLDEINIKEVYSGQYEYVQTQRANLYFIAVQILKNLDLKVKCSEQKIGENYESLIAKFIDSLDKNELNQDQIFGVNLILGDLANIERTSENLAIAILCQLL